MVSIRNEKNQEVMLKGLSIGFKKKAGDEVDESKIEYRFVLEDNSVVKRFDEINNELDKETINVCMEAVTRIKKRSKFELSDSIYVTFIDHINNLIDQIQAGIKFDNSILWDMRRIYPEEYFLASETVEFLNANLVYTISKDEASFIALHIVNAERTNDMHKTYQLTTVINDICDIVGSNLGIEFNEEDYFYNRFVMHLRFLLEREPLNISVNKKTDNKVLKTLITSYPQLWKIVKNIVSYIRVCLQRSLTQDEELYLMIHLSQIFDENKKD